MGWRVVCVGLACCGALSFGSAQAQTYDALPRLSLSALAVSPAGHADGRTGVEEVPTTVVKPRRGAVRAVRDLDLGAVAMKLSDSSLARATLVEMPREQIPGQYARPRYALGLRSTTMKRWAQNMGLDADACLAPIVRMRTKIEDDGGISGTFWLHARCRFR